MKKSEKAVVITLNDIYKIELSKKEFNNILNLLDSAESGILIELDYVSDSYHHELSNLLYEIQSIKSKFINSKKHIKP